MVELYLHATEILKLHSHLLWVALPGIFSHLYTTPRHYSLIDTAKLFSAFWREHLKSDATDFKRKMQFELNLKCTILQYHSHLLHQTNELIITGNDNEAKRLWMTRVRKAITYVYYVLMFTTINSKYNVSILVSWYNCYQWISEDDAARGNS